MNLNIVAYTIYLAVTAFIIVVVGWICYRNGNRYVAALVPDHLDLCHTVNRMLLIGYYLVNIGYCGLTLVRWKAILSQVQLVETVSFRTAFIVLLLAAMHYLNIFLIKKYIRKFIH